MNSLYGLHGLWILYCYKRTNEQKNTVQPHNDMSSLSLCPPSLSIYPSIYQFICFPQKTRCTQVETKAFEAAVKLSVRKQEEDMRIKLSSVEGPSIPFFMSICSYKWHTFNHLYTYCTLLVPDMNTVPVRPLVVEFRASLLLVWRQMSRLRRWWDMMAQSGCMATPTCTLGKESGNLSGSGKCAPEAHPRCLSGVNVERRKPTVLSQWLVGFTVKYFSCALCSSSKMYSCLWIMFLVHLGNDESWTNGGPIGSIHRSTCKTNNMFSQVHK